MRDMLNYEGLQYEEIRSVIPTTRPDLTDYRIYIDVLLEKLNEDSVYKMSIEDLMKLLIEKAMQNYCPDVVIAPSRKRYETLKF